MHTPTVCNSVARLPEGLTMSYCLLQLKQTLLVLVLLHDHTSHVRTRKVAHGCG